MLGQVRDKNQAEAAFAAAFGNPCHLFEKDFHPFNSLGSFF
jgi:hypothetical protein